MFAKALTTALVSTALLTGAMATQSFAMGGGDGSGYRDPEPAASLRNPDGSTVSARRNRDGGRVVIHRDANGKIVNQQVHKKPAKRDRRNKKSRPFAESFDPNTGITTTVRGNRDGSRTVTKKDRRGRVISRQNRGGNNRPWASSYDPATGTRTTSIGLGDGTRAVITIGILGLAIGLSH